MSNVARNKTAAYLLLGKEIKELKAKQDQIKAEMEHYFSEAETNTRGSYVIPFDELLFIDDQPYKSLQKVRKESKVLNEDRVIEYMENCTSAIRKDGYVGNIKVLHQTWHVDQDGLWQMFVNDMLTQEELDSFFDINISYAFMPTKE